MIFFKNALFMFHTAFKILKNYLLFHSAEERKSCKFEMT